MRLMPALLATCLSVSPALAAVETCTRPEDRLAFDMEGLKSQLMVTALACKVQDKYNAFMRTYQPDLARQEKNLSAYFKRAYGRQYQKAYDDYISNLANVQEQEGLKAGTSFCDNLPNMFDEVMSLHDASELPDYAHSQPIVQPIAFSTCTALPAEVHAAKVRRTRKAKHTSP
jgi:hypothetical protein